MGMGKRSRTEVLLTCEVAAGNREGGEACAGEGWGRVVEVPRYTYLVELWEEDFDLGASWGVGIGYGSLRRGGN
jgi:hypothetical protein